MLRVFTQTLHSFYDGAILGIRTLAFVTGEVPASPTVNKTVVGRFGSNQTPLIYCLTCCICCDLAKRHFLKAKTNHADHQDGHRCYP